MTNKYKISKKWSELTDDWYWYVYVENSFLGIKYWERIGNIAENTKEDAEYLLEKHVREQAEIERNRKAPDEEYFLEM